MSQKLPFLTLIFGLLESQKTLLEPNEFLSAFVQPYVFRMKEKGTVTKWDQDSAVATKKPSIATDAQQGPSSSTVVQSFIRTELRAIKERQLQQDQKMDKASAQLKQIEELLCYILIILKRTSPTKPANPTVATEALEADLEPPVATSPKPKSSPSKKWKKKLFYFVSFLHLFSN